MKNKRIIIFIDWYLPAFRAGGPIVAAANFVMQMQDRFEIFVITSTLDLGEENNLPGIVPDTWMSNLQGVKTWYSSPANLSYKTVKEKVKEIDPDYIYLHSLFSLYFTIFPLLVSGKREKQPKWILAPRGMLRESALKRKYLKKKLFLIFFRLLRFNRKVIFQATDETELRDVYAHFGKSSQVRLLPDFGVQQKSLNKPFDKIAGCAKILFIGRVHPIKNLHFLLNALKSIKGKVELIIVGNLEDITYWEHCRVIIDELADNIKVELFHAIPHHKMEELIRVSHLMALPTKGENFGHAIYESLSVGTPVLISDQTMWRNLALTKAGWDIPLDLAAFSEKLQLLINMDIEEFKVWSLGAWNYCRNYNDRTDIVKLYDKVFI